jgi:hypothetical protein
LSQKDSAEFKKLCKENKPRRFLSYYHLLIGAATFLLIPDEKITMMCYGLSQQTAKERNET